MKKMKINLFILFVAIFSFFHNNCEKIKFAKTDIVTIVSPVDTKFKKIKAGSFLEWRASHLGGVGKRLGKIYYKEATISFNNKRLTNIYITIDMDRLTVENLSKDDNKELEEHLKSTDFFDVKNYPLSKFELTNLETLKGKYNSKITGNLTILDVSKSISFNANIKISENEVHIQSENFIIDRSNWGLTYNKKGSKGVPLNYLISDDIGFTVDITVVK